MLSRASVFFFCALAAAQQQPSPEGRLRRAAQHAKAKGVAEIKLPPPIFLPTGVSTVYELIHDYTLLRVAIVDTATTSDDDNIRTWYKLKILETFSLQPSISRGELPAGVPPSFLPIGESET